MELNGIYWALILILNHLLPSRYTSSETALAYAPPSHFLSPAQEEIKQSPLLRGAFEWPIYRGHAMLVYPNRTNMVI